MTEWLSEQECLRCLHCDNVSVVNSKSVPGFPVSVCPGIHHHHFLLSNLWLSCIKDRKSRAPTSAFEGLNPVSCGPKQQACIPIALEIMWHQNPRPAASELHLGAALPFQQGPCIPPLDGHPLALGRLNAQAWDSFQPWDLSEASFSIGGWLAFQAWLELENSILGNLVWKHCSPWPWGNSTLPCSSNCCWENIFNGERKGANHLVTLAHGGPSAPQPGDQKKKESGKE